MVMEIIVLNCIFVTYGPIYNIVKRTLSWILIILISLSGLHFADREKITPSDWQHWKSGGAHFDLKLTSTGFSLFVLKAGVNKHDIQVYSNNELNIAKDKYYILRFKVKSNKDSVTFNSRLGSESEEINYCYRAITVKEANREELKEIQFVQKDELIKFLKLYFEFGQVDPDVRIEINDVEITEEK